MSVYFKSGDLLKSDCDFICHQVNCQGRMASGIAKQIRTKWPIVYKMYMDMAKEIEIGFGDIQLSWEYMLGGIQGVPINDDKTRFVINMFAQKNYGYDGKRYTSYDAFWNCLHEIKETTPKGSTIGFPDHIGCGLGGANWEVIYTMIEEVLGENYTVYIYSLEGNV